VCIPNNRAGWETRRNLDLAVYNGNEQGNAVHCLRDGRGDLKDENLTGRVSVISVTSILAGNFLPSFWLFHPSCLS
jgi:hypothetical protein